MLTLLFVKCHIIICTKVGVVISITLDPVISMSNHLKKVLIVSVIDVRLKLLVYLLLVFENHVMAAVSFPSVSIK